MKMTLSTFVLAFLLTGALAQVKTVSSDTEWERQHVVLKNSIEAELIIRVGDADNLNFGWPESFDPFCGRMTEAHYFPWQPNEDDLAGFDRILLSSKFVPAQDYRCSSDGYSGSFDAATSRPVTWSIPTTAINGVNVQNAFLQIFIDDFQAPTFCSKFQILLNGKRFIEGEKVLNAIDQTGPVGKLITIPLNEEYYSLLSSSTNFTVLIDESTGSADGFAVDFIRLLVNRKRESSCIGNVRGRVVEKGTDRVIAKAKVTTSEKVMVETNAKGEFELKNIPTGLVVLSASALGYSDGTATADVGESTQDDVVIYLETGRTTKFDNRQVKVGETIRLDNILFDQSKAVIKNESKPTLEKVIAFMKSNPTVEVELSGHTSSEGERDLNLSLSYKRVKACKDYIVAAGIAEERLVAVGYGQDRPTASNDTEAGRIQNRRVEMRITKL